tara:strand:- start:5755 stop:7089 length:1335 start_codon:yes stop_codon:yes gene_type:complete
MKKLRYEYERIKNEYIILQNGNNILKKENNLYKGDRIVLCQRINSLKKENKAQREKNKKLRKTITKLSRDMEEFNDTPIIKNINNLCDYWFLNVNDLLNLRWKAPYFQRPVDGERVKDIVEHYQKKLNNNIFEFISPLIVAKYDNMLYIIDGQHRFKAIEYLFGHDEKFNEDKKVPLVVIPARSMEHIEDLFQTLNKLLPLSDVYKLQDKNKKKIIVETSDYFFKKYRNFFTTKKARRPFINKNDFENFLLNSDIIDELDIIDSSTDFTFLLEKVNSFYSLQPTSFFPQKGQVNFDKIIDKIKKKGGLYLGLFPKFEWIKHIKEKIWENDDNILGKGIRDQVWNEYIGIDKGTEKCFCCKIQVISQQNFETGHIISKKKGGSNNLINLLPICSKCNKSMGVTAMFEYMSKNNINLDYSNKLKKIFELNTEKFYNKTSNINSYKN